MSNTDWRWIVLAAVAAAVVTWFDTHMPLGYGIWVLYLTPVLIVAGAGRDILLYLTTLFLAGLMAVGVLFSPGTLTTMSVINRVSSYLLFWVVTVVLAGRIRALKLSREHEQSLISANQDLESFSYSVSHDLRGPLNTIGNLAEVLQQNYADSLDSVGRECVMHIKDNISRMGLIIDDILCLSRVDRMETDRTRTNLSAIVRQFVEELRGAQPQRQVDFRIHEDVYAEADARLISLAIQNLIRNAWKFSAKRDVTRIEFGTCAQAGKTVYFIRDNGVGFDQQFARQIFEPFRRVHDQQEYSGTGIGLSIVDRVISRHGGRVWAEGQVDKGASFFFTLE